jgi:hypothetical protein
LPLALSSCGGGVNPDLVGIDLCRTFESEESPETLQLWELPKSLTAKGSRDDSDARRGRGRDGGVVSCHDVEIVGRLEEFEQSYGPDIPYWFFVRTTTEPTREGWVWASHSGDLEALRKIPVRAVATVDLDRATIAESLCSRAADGGPSETGNVRVWERPPALDYFYQYAEGEGESQQLPCDEEIEVVARLEAVPVGGGFTAIPNWFLVRSKAASAAEGWAWVSADRLLDAEGFPVQQVPDVGNGAPDLTFGEPYYPQDAGDECELGGAITAEINIINSGAGTSGREIAVKTRFADGSTEVETHYLSAGLAPSLRIAVPAVSGSEMFLNPDGSDGGPFGVSSGVIPVSGLESR